MPTPLSWMSAWKGHHWQSWQCVMTSTIKSGFKSFGLISVTMFAVFSGRNNIKEFLIFNNSVLCFILFWSTSCHVRNNLGRQLQQVRSKSLLGLAATCWHVNPREVSEGNYCHQYDFKLPNILHLLCKLCIQVTFVSLLYRRFLELHCVSQYNFTCCAVAYLCQWCLGLYATSNRPPATVIITHPASLFNKQST